MIGVKHVPEPAGFDEKVRKPGNKWLRSNSKAVRPKPLWISFIGELRDGFNGLCAYAALYDATGGTVDHYRSFKNHRSLAYEWDNYRFASATLNASKKDADDSILDPYEVRAGWFEIILPSLQLRATDAIPERFREKAEFTLKRLKLRDGERIIRWRRSWYEMYENGELTLNGLRKMAPLIADAVDRQERARKKSGKSRKSLHV